LAEYLADSFDYPAPERDLVRVSQYVSVVLGDAPLYDELHDVFAAEYDSTPLHHFLASLPGGRAYVRGAAARSLPLR
jgi:hypothetical protein